MGRAFLAAGAFQFDAARSLKELALVPGAPPILCDEALCGSPYTGGHMGLLSASVARRIRSVLPDARIVVFVRAQPEMIAATYQQYVRLGGTHSAQRFLWPGDYSHALDSVPNRFPRFSFDHFEYDRLIAHYCELFGTESVRVYAYEELRSEGKEFLDRFARELGLDLARVPMERRNVSFTRSTLQLARFANRFTAHKVSDKHHWVHIPGWYSVRKRALAALDRGALRGLRATPEQVLGAPTIRWIRDRYCESNRRLAHATTLDLARLGYPVDAPLTHAPRPLAPRWRWWYSR